MGCPKTTIPPADKLAARRATIDGLFRRGKLDEASWLRWRKCCEQGDCHRLCPEIDVVPGENPTCGGIDLYAALKRRDFQCPDGQW